MYHVPILGVMCDASQRHYTERRCRVDDILTQSSLGLRLFLGVGVPWLGVGSVNQGDAGLGWGFRLALLQPHSEWGVLARSEWQQRVDR